MKPNLKTIVNENSSKLHSGKIGTDIMRKKMGEVLDCVYLRSDEFIIERKNKPMAVLIPIEKYESLNNLSKDNLLKLYNKAANTKISETEAEELANEVKHLVRGKTV